MKRFHWLAAIPALFSASAMPPVAAETLSEALTAAYRTSPVIDSARADLAATDEGVAQAVSGWRPTVIVTAEAGKERRWLEPGDRKETIDPKSAVLTVTQPLYRGGRTVAETASAEALVRAGRETLSATEQSVFLDAVTAYMDVLRDQAVVRLNDNNVRVLERQLEAAQDRFRVGEVTRTDVSQAEARLAGAVSDRVAAQGNLEDSRATYERVIGNPPNALEPPPPLPELPGDLVAALQTADAENPNINRRLAEEEASRFDIRSSSSQLLPTLDLQGRLTITDQQTSSNSEFRSAEIAAQLTVPLYQSGAVYSRVREARQVNNLRRIQVSDQRRAVREQTIQAWADLTTAQAQIKSNREQVRANEIALEGVSQEAQVGSRTTLDVLDAEQELLDSQVDLVQSERDAYVAAFGLLNAVGRLSFETLAIAADRYDPSANYDRVRDKWIGTDGGLD